MSEFQYADVEIEGRKLTDYLESDEGLVDYSKSEFGKNVSNTKEYVIFDLGEYEYDSTVKPIYYNGLDLSRIAACSRYHTPYGGMRLFTALEGDDHMRIFFNSYVGATIQEFIFAFFSLIDGDMYISESSYHVYVKGRIGTKEEREEVIKVMTEKYKFKKGE